MHLPKRKSEKNQATIQSTPTKQHPRASRLKLTLGINRELAVAVAVGEHPRGVELPQGPPPALLGRASEDLVVVGVVQEAQHLGQRQVDVYFVSTACGTTRETVSFVGAAPDLVPGLHFSRDHARLTDATPASRETRVSTEHWYPIHLERMPNAPPDTTFAEPIIHFPSPHTADLFLPSFLSTFLSSSTGQSGREDRSRNVGGGDSLHFLRLGTGVETSIFPRSHVDGAELILFFAFSRKKARSRTLYILVGERVWRFLGN